MQNRSVPSFWRCRFVDLPRRHSPAKKATKRTRPWSRSSNWQASGSARASTATRNTRRIVYKVTSGGSAVVETIDPAALMKW